MSPRTPKGVSEKSPHAVGRRQSWRESAARRSWGKTPLGAGAGRSAAAVLLKEAERESRERTHRRREASPFASLPAGVLAVAFPHAAPVSSQHRERDIPTKQSPARRLRRRLRTGPSIGPRNCTAGVPGGRCGGGECMSARAPAAARSLAARLPAILPWPDARPPAAKRRGPAALGGPAPTRQCRDLPGLGAGLAGTRIAAGRAHPHRWR